MNAPPMPPTRPQPPPTPDTYCLALEAAGHKLSRLENGDFSMFDFGEYHEGVFCDLCGELICFHCPEPIKPCPGQPGKGVEP